MIFWVLFIPFLIFAQEEPAAVVETTVPSVVAVLPEISSPFFSCAMRAASPSRRRGGRAEVPLLSDEHRNDLKTREFLMMLQTRVQSKVEESLDFSRRTTVCFRTPLAESGDNRCSRFRAQFDPIRYPAQPSPAVGDTLIQNIKNARAHLALANPNPSFGQSMVVNSDLEPYGFKANPWHRLSDSEQERAQARLNIYKEQFKNKHNLSEQEFNSLLRPYDRSAEHQIYANPMNRSESEVQHMVMQSELERSFAKVRGGHLEEYRAILARFPIINYLSSSDPSLLEIQTAGLQMQENAQRELEQIQNVGELLNHPQFSDGRVRAQSSNFSSSILNLLDYRSVTEDLLAEHPEYCAVATAIEQEREKIQMARQVLLAAPFLAVSFFAPPVAAVAAAAMSIGFTYSSYQHLNDQRQAAYMTPFNDGSLRATQFSVDEAQRIFRTDLTMIAVDGLMGGGIGALGRRAGLNGPRRKD